jgi:hypothetical protein
MAEGVSRDASLCSQLWSSLASRSDLSRGFINLSLIERFLKISQRLPENDVHGRGFGWLCSPFLDYDRQRLNQLPEQIARQEMEVDDLLVCCEVSIRSKLASRKRLDRIGWT